MGSVTRWPVIHETTRANTRMPTSNIPGAGLIEVLWNTRTQFVDLGAVATVALLCTVAATFIERRRYQQIG